MTKLLFVYFAAINILAFCFFGIDKYKAKTDQWRISEKALILMAILGGSPGAWAGMYCFRHKTRKLKFSVGIPCILIIQVLLWMYLH